MQEMRGAISLCLLAYLTAPQGRKHLTSDEEARQLHPFAIQNFVWLR